MNKATTEGRLLLGTQQNKASNNKRLTHYDNEDEEIDVIGADLHFDEVVEAARDGGVDVVLTIYELERYIDAQDRREEAYHEM